jgi:hypothetical protein
LNSPDIFEKYRNVKFHENPSNGTRVVPCGQKAGQGHNKKLKVAFRNFSNAPKTEGSGGGGCGGGGGGGGGGSSSSSSSK